LSVPSSLNDIVLEPGEIHLQTLQDIIEVLKSTPGARTSDVSAFYTHFPLPQEARAFYCFWFKGQVYCVKTICTGQRQCPTVAHLLTDSITQRSTRGEFVDEGVLATMLVTPTTGLAYIDDVALAGVESAVASAHDRPFFLLRLCQHPNGTAIASKSNVTIRY
jgi:hypothetical protein